MQAVILAAGEGTRMRPLTLTCPKPLIKVANKPLIEHVMDAVPDSVTEFIIVVGYLGDQIVSHIGNEYNGRPVRYVWQEVKNGTYGALSLAQDMLHGKFLVLLADDLIDGKSLERASQRDLSVLVYEHPEPERFGVIVPHIHGTVKEIVEKPKVPPSNFINTGAMILDTRIFNFPPEEQANGEYYIPHALTSLARETPVHIEPMDFWCPVGRPEDIGVAEERLFERA